MSLGRIRCPSSNHGRCNNPSGESATTAVRQMHTDVGIIHTHLQEHAALGPRWAAITATVCTVRTRRILLPPPWHTLVRTPAMCSISVVPFADFVLHLQTRMVESGDGLRQRRSHSYPERHAHPELHAFLRKKSKELILYKMSLVSADPLVSRSSIPPYHGPPSRSQHHLFPSTSDELPVRSIPSSSLIRPASSRVVVVIARESRSLSTIACCPCHDSRTSPALFSSWDEHQRRVETVQLCGRVQGLSHVDRRGAAVASPPPRAGAIACCLPAWMGRRCRHLGDRNKGSATAAGAPPVRGFMWRGSRLMEAGGAKGLVFG